MAGPDSSLHHLRAKGISPRPRPGRRLAWMLVGVACLHYPQLVRGEYIGTLGSGLNGPVFAVTVSHGVLYAAGGFSGRGDGSGALARVAKLVGSEWVPLGDLGTFGPIRCLLARGDSLLVGGDLYRAGSTPVRGIAVWDGSSWSALGAGLDGAVQCLAVHGGQLVAGGDFDGSGEVRCNGLARWDGAAWHAMGLGPHTGQVRALAVYGGDLFVGGTALDVPGIAGELPALARWDGSSWSGVSGGLGAGELITGPIAIGGRINWTRPAGVMSLVEFDGRLVIGGQFSSAWNGGEALSVRGLVQWDGAHYAKVGGASLLPTYEGSANVLALAVYQGMLCIGGYFQQVDLEGGACVPSSDFAVWDGDMWIDPDEMGFNDCSIQVSGLAVYNGCLVMACRSQGKASGQIVQYLNRWAPGCSGIETPDGSAPARTMLAAVYPNPANPRVQIAFDLAEAGRAVVAVYNAAGRQVAVVADQRLPAGHHATLWDGKDRAGVPVASSVYEIVLKTDAGSFARKVTLAR